MNNMKKQILKKSKTCELVDELRKREGVEVMSECGPDEAYQLGDIIYKGPMIVLKVID